MERKDYSVSTRLVIEDITAVSGYETQELLNVIL
jgi:hypothetical protein